MKTKACRIVFTRDFEERCDSGVRFVLFCLVRQINLTIILPVIKSLAESFAHNHDSVRVEYFPVVLGIRRQDDSHRTGESAPAGIVD